LPLKGHREESSLEEGLARRGTSATGVRNKERERKVRE
jgi:hypothetical protein